MAAIFTETSVFEVLNVNMIVPNVNPEPAQEIKHLSFTSQASDAIQWITAQSMDSGNGTNITNGV